MRSLIIKLTSVLIMGVHAKTSSNPNTTETTTTDKVDQNGNETETTTTDSNKNSAASTLFGSFVAISLLVMGLTM